MQALTQWLRRQSSWIESQQASILSAATIIFIANVASAIAGLAKNRVLSSTYVNSTYGQSLDAYWVAFRAPEFAYQLIVLGSLSSAFIPVFAHWYKKDKNRAFDIANETMYLLLGIFSLASLAIFIFAPQFISILTAPEFAHRESAVDMTRIMMGAQMLFGLSAFFSAMLQSAKRFVIPAFSPVFYNVGIILATLFLTPWLGLYAAAWGTVLGAFLHMVIQIPLVFKIGYRINLFPTWRKDDLLDFFQLTGPRTLALGVDQLNLWVITFYATASGDLTLTMITFAQQLMTLPIRFFGVSIAQAALPFLSAEQEDRIGFRTTVFRSLRQIVFFSAPASVLLLVLRVPLVRLAYGTDGFPWRATLITAEAVGILALSIAPQSANHLLIRAFYALNNTVTPLFSSLVSLLVTIGLGWYLSIHLDWGIRGMAIALALSGFMEMVFLLGALLYKIGYADVKSFIFSLLRIGLASFLMAATLFIFQRLLDLYVFETSRTFQLIQLTAIVSALGGVVYVGFCWIFQIEELTILQRIFQKLRHQLWKTVNSTPEFVESVSQVE